MIALMHQCALMSAFGATPLLQKRGATSLRDWGSNKVAEQGSSSRSSRVCRRARQVLVAKMQTTLRSLDADAWGPDLGKRPAGPDPFNMVQGDMARIKSKIKGIADRAMSSSSASPLLLCLRLPFARSNKIFLC